MASEDSGLLWFVVLLALLVQCDRIEKLEKREQPAEEVKHDE